MPEPSGPWPADRPEAWPVHASRDLHRDAWVMALREDLVSRPGHDDDQFHRLVLEHPGSAVVLAVDDDERLLVLEQYRHAAGHRLVELPAGLLDSDGEDALATAQRELREEAELEAETWEHLLTLRPSPGISSERLVIFVARGLSPCPRGDFVPRHEEADLSAHWVSSGDLLDAVLDGRVTSGPLVAAVLAHARRGGTPGPAEGA